MKINLTLLTLGSGAFGIGVTEFTPTGMLPLIAADLHVSIPSAGLLVIAYALGVLFGAPIMTLAFARVPRRTLLVGLLGIFTLGSLMSAMADSYVMQMVARVVTSFNHDAFFGVGSVVAASVVSPDKHAGAAAAMFSGLTIATIGGIPLAAWDGGRPSGALPESVRWRWWRFAWHCRRSPSKQVRIWPASCASCGADRSWQRSRLRCWAPPRCSPYSPTSFQFSARRPRLRVPS
jgi:MFS family permease